MDGRTLALCRKVAGLSLEKASEMLGICVKSLWNYEHDKRDTPLDVLINMARIYNAGFLLADYCKTCIVGQARGQPRKCVKKKIARRLCLAM